MAISKESIKTYGILRGLSFLSDVGCKNAQIKFYIVFELKPPAKRCKSKMRKKEIKGVDLSLVPFHLGVRHLQSIDFLERL